MLLCSFLCRAESLGEYEHSLHSEGCSSHLSKFVLQMCFVCLIFIEKGEVQSPFGVMHNWWGQPALNTGCPGNSISNLTLTSGVLKLNSWLSTEKFEQGVETQVGIPQNKSGCLRGLARNN